MVEKEYDESVFGKIVGLKPDQIPVIKIHCMNGHYLTTVTMHPGIKIISMKIKCFTCGVVTSASNLFMEYQGKIEEIDNSDLR